MTSRRSRIGALPIVFAAWVVVLLGGLAALAVTDASGSCAVGNAAVEDAGLDPTAGVLYGDVEWQALPFGPSCVADVDGQTVTSGPGVLPSVWVAVVAAGAVCLIWLLARSDRERRAQADDVA